MWNYIWPILIVVASNTFYNICAKATPGDIHPMASLAVTYLAGAIGAITIFFLTRGGNLIAEIRKANWATYVLALAIIGLEFGYICIYRAGWKVSAGSLVANISLACVLLFVGALLYKEVISIRQIFGMVLCVAGIILVGK